MSTQLLRSHLYRVWSRHWALQVASVSVMTMVLMMLNALFLGYGMFNRTVDQWGRGLEMTVYLKDTATWAALQELDKQIRDSGSFDQIQQVNKAEATRKFLTALGGESLELLSDPKWSSPIPASYELRMVETSDADQRLNGLQAWSARFRGMEAVEDVFYGQGWIENFSRFLSGARVAVVLVWILGLSVGLLIVSNCIRLSFMQRVEEIEVLELVGATPSFIRAPFLLEGVALGVFASLLSLAISYGLHSALLAWLGQAWSFWFAFQDLSPLSWWAVAANIVSGIIFGAVGAWNCVRRLNTGWAAAS